MQILLMLQLSVNKPGFGYLHFGLGQVACVGLVYPEEISSNIGTGWTAEFGAHFRPAVVKEASIRLSL